MSRLRDRMTRPQRLPYLVRIDWWRPATVNNVHGMSRAAAIDAVNHPRRACMRLVIKSSQSRRDPAALLFTAPRHTISSPLHCDDNPRRSSRCRAAVRRTARLKANSHRHARHDKTVLSVSRPFRRGELDSRQLKTVADRKFEVWTRSQQSSSSQRHTRHDTDRTVLLCLCELSRPDRPTSAFIVGVCRATQILAMRPPRPTRLSYLPVSKLNSRHDTDSTVLSCLADGVNWALFGSSMHSYIGWHSRL